MQSIDTPKASTGYGGTAQTQGFEFRIVGDNVPFIEMVLAPTVEVIAESGSLMAKSTDVTASMVLGDGSSPSILGKIWNTAARKFSGEKNYLMRCFTNASDGNRLLYLASPIPGEIAAINLAEQDGEIVCQKGAFMAAPRGVNITFHLKKKIRASLFGGEGFVMQKIRGNDWVFLNGGGNLSVHDLAEGEQIDVDTGCLVAVSGSATMDIGLSGGPLSWLYGEEGLFLSRIGGPGRVWVQSMPHQRYIESIQKSIQPVAPPPQPT